MNLKEIEALIKLVKKSGVSEVSVDMKDFKITVKTQGNGTHAANAPVVVAAAPAPVAPVHAPAVAAAPAPAPPKPEAPDDSTFITVRSPMIGTFYRTPSPDKPPFVNVGDDISEGKVLCIIEAMKLFNEIESEVTGKIVKVLAENASPVEYDQPLFLVEPS
ncbi:MAG TPA: acetyl-CoA carboxylase biotin carboxyl carrier protein [Bacteroidia bacterium]|nr:acetyl-CoA carboxylase biotin carboxyl carrier protein [Bacteroidia bacterium]